MKMNKIEWSENQTQCDLRLHNFPNMNRNTKCIICGVTVAEAIESYSRYFKEGD